MCRGEHWWVQPHVRLMWWQQSNLCWHSVASSHKNVLPPAEGVWWCKIISYPWSCMYKLIHLIMSPGNPHISEGSHEAYFQIILLSTANHSTPSFLIHSHLHRDTSSFSIILPLDSSIGRAAGISRFNTLLHRIFSISLQIIRNSLYSWFWLKNVLSHHASSQALLLFHVL